MLVYHGPTCYPGFKGYIRAILVFASSNRKTGRMAQLHILPNELAPHVAQRTGADARVCGMCPLRPILGGGCYVVTCQGPNSTWKAHRAAPVAGAAEIAGALQGATLRLGAYGDPAALPPYLVRWLVSIVNGRATGYTHGWQTRPDLRPFCMASVHSPAEAELARAQGWRYFRATAPGAAPLPWEIECPSPRVTCEACMLCTGAATCAKDIRIEVHGSRSRAALRVVS